MDLLAIYKQFVERQRLWNVPDKLLLAVSGGPDSVAMVDLTARLGMEFGISHVNFGLRGAESDGDEEFVRQLAVRYGAEIYVTRADTMAYANMKGISVEMAAREIRYSEFDRIMDNFGYNATGVAHHRDDAIETFFLNLMRGSGIRGLTGMKVRNGRIVRPLLCFSRAEIESYLSENQLSYRIDRTNLENEYTRNKIRNIVMPAIDGIKDGARSSIVESIGYLGLAKNIYDDAINKASLSVVRGVGESVVIDIAGVLRFVEPECLLFEILSQYDFGKAQCHEVFRQLESESGKIFYSNSHRLVKDRDTLIVSRLEDVKAANGRAQVIVLRSAVDAGVLKTHFWTLRMEVMERDAFTPVRDPLTVYFDLDKLRFPMSVTGWVPGDSFVPFGSPHRKKLSDLFIDNKLSRSEKDCVEVLRCDDNIFWVIGIRPGNCCRVTQSTVRILKITAERLTNQAGDC